MEHRALLSSSSDQLPTLRSDDPTLLSAGDVGGFVSTDWRSGEPIPAKTSRPVRLFGKAVPLHLRASLGSHERELERARDVTTAAENALAEAIETIQSGEGPSTPELLPVIDGVTASLLRDARALPGIRRIQRSSSTLYAHSVSVCGLMIALAHEMNFEAEMVRQIGLAGLLHDIGKLSRNASSPEGLTSQAAPASRMDPGVLELLTLDPSMPTIVFDVCLEHLERLDGSGSPNGLRGDDISTIARMAAICDFYDAMTCPDQGAERWSPIQSIEHLQAASTQFDGKIVKCFGRVIGSFLPGQLVRVRSDRLAVVLDDTDRDPLHPMVVVFQDLRGRQLPPVRLHTKHDPIISIEKAESWGLVDWPRQRAAFLSHSQ